MAPTETVNPWAGYAIGADWAWHIKNNGGRGGTDYKVAAGVAVRSPCAGMASHLNDGLNTIVVVRNDGVTFHLEENRSVVGSFPREVGLLEEIAITGLDRLNIVRWPHIHEQDASGVRHAFDEPAVNAPYLVAAAAPVPQNVTTDEVKRIAAYLNARNLGKTTTASSTGINVLPGSSSSNYYWEIQKAGMIDGVYPKDDLLNGIPGPATFAAEKHYAALTDPAPVEPPIVTPPVVDPPVVNPPVTDPVTPTDPPVTTTPVEPPSDDDPIETDPITPPATTDPVTPVTPPATTDPVTPTEPVTPPVVTPPTTTPVTPTKPTTPTTPKQDGWILTFIKLFLSVFVGPKKK